MRHQPTTECRMCLIMWSDKRNASKIWLSPPPTAIELNNVWFMRGMFPPSVKCCCSRCLSEGHLEYVSEMLQALTKTAAF